MYQVTSERSRNKVLIKKISLVCSIKHVINDVNDFYCLSIVCYNHTNLLTYLSAWIWHVSLGVSHSYHMYMYNIAIV